MQLDSNSGVGGWINSSPQSQDARLQDVMQAKLQAERQNYVEGMQQKQNELAEAKSHWFFPQPTKVEMLQNQLNAMPNETQLSRSFIKNQYAPMNKAWGTE